MNQRKYHNPLGMPIAMLTIFILTFCSCNRQIVKCPKFSHHQIENDCFVQLDLKITKPIDTIFCKSIPSIIQE